jgi:hypothetical protein
MSLHSLALKVRHLPLQSLGSKDVVDLLARLSVKKVKSPFLQVLKGALALPNFTSACLKG